MFWTRFCSAWSRVDSFINQLILPSPHTWDTPPLVGTAQPLAPAHLARIVLDPEAAVWQGRVIEEPWALAHPALEVLVGGTHLVQLFQEGLIGNCAGPQALFVQHGQDSVCVLEKGNRSLSFLPPSIVWITPLNYSILHSQLQSPGNSAQLQQNAENPSKSHKPQNSAFLKRAGSAWHLLPYTTGPGVAAVTLPVLTSISQRSNANLKPMAQWSLHHHKAKSKAITCIHSHEGNWLHSFPNCSCVQNIPECLGAINKYWMLLLRVTIIMRFSRIHSA